MFRNLLTGALALLTLIVAAASASAEGIAMYGEEGRNVVTLKYSDADIHTAHGAKLLALRVRVAAARVCGGDVLVVRTGDPVRETEGAVQNTATSRITAKIISPYAIRPTF